MDDRRPRLNEPYGADEGVQGRLRLSGLLRDSRDRNAVLNGVAVSLGVVLEDGGGSPKNRSRGVVRILD